MNRAFCSGIDRTKAEEIAKKIVPVSPGPAAYKPGRITQAQGCELPEVELRVFFFPGDKPEV